MTLKTLPPEPIIDPDNTKIHRWPDLGLTLIHDFISPSEEATMVAAFHARDPDLNPKRRVSQHYGYHFDYTTFGASETEYSPIPDYITAFLPRLPLQDCIPDQFTVQYYPPGTGIPPHVDTHSMFEEPLYSLSFGSAVPMTFRLAGPNDARKMRLPRRSAMQSEGEGAAPPPPSSVSSQTGGDETVHPSWDLMLPPRSLLLMMGPSRYGYTHAIRPRKNDVVDGVAVPRKGRYSITMRKVRRGEQIKCDCPYPGVCDARIREEMALARAQACPKGQDENDKHTGESAKS